MSNRKPKRFALKYDPPAIVLEYEDLTTKKLNLLTMHLNALTATSNPIEVSTKVKDHFGRRVPLTGKTEKQLDRLVKKLIDSCSVDLNKVDPEDLNKAKAQMNNVFEMNRLKPGDPGYVYEIEKEFVPTEECDWDDD